MRVCHCVMRREGCLLWEKGSLARGANEKDPRMGCARLASSSTGRGNLTFEGGRFVFQESGITLGGRRVQRARWESGTRCLRREGKDGQRQPAARLIVGAAQTSLREAIRRLCGMMAWRGGMQASADSMGMGVDVKQFDTQCLTCRQ